MKVQDKLPSFQFYPSDWLNDLSLKLCSYETKGVWIDLLCWMHKSPERGVLIVGNAPLDKKKIQILTNLSPKKFQKVFTELIQYNILKVDEMGRYYCARMVKDEHIRMIRKECGKKGGNPNLVNNLVKQKVKQKNNQKTTLSSSSSSSMSLKEKNNKKEIFAFIDERLNVLFNSLNNVKKLEKQLTEEEGKKLEEKFSSDAISEVLMAMENHKDLIKKYKSVYLTSLNWLKNRKNGQANNNKQSFDQQIQNW